METEINAAIKPLNGMRATMFHDEGAVAQCFYCRRYTMNEKALTDRPPTCECGHKYGWCGSFEPPASDAQWSGISAATEGQKR